MAVNPETKAKIEAELALGVSVSELSRRYDVPYITITSWNNKLKAARDSDKVKDLVVVTPQTLSTVAEAVKERAPARVCKEIDRLVEGVTGLQSLEPKFHAVTLSLLERAEEFANSDDLTLVEWDIISRGIGRLYNDIFNKSGISVNVNNNTQINNEKLSMFKSSMRDS